jgi:hypothetical protein
MRAPARPLPETVEIALRDLTDDGFGARDLIARIRAAQAPLLEGHPPGAA